MSTAVTLGMNFLGNTLQSILSDPKGAQHPDLAIGAAFDVVKNTPIDQYSNVPHFQLEESTNESPAVPAGSPGG